MNWKNNEILFKNFFSAFCNGVKLSKFIRYKLQ
jgi:hypothetical protein